MGAVDGSVLERVRDGVDLVVHLAGQEHQGGDQCDGDADDDHDPFDGALRAQGSIEWVVIVVCIAVALIAALVFLSGEMNNKINTVANTLKNTTVHGAHAGN